MVPQTGKTERRLGISLVETMIAVVILMIGLIGTFTLRYAAALDGRRAEARTTATRIALMLCESWRGLNGDETYDPATHFGSDLTVIKGTGPDCPDDFTLLGSYTISCNRGAVTDNYLTTLSWKDIQPGLRALNVVVAWASRDQQGSAMQQIGDVSVDKSSQITVYTQTY